MVRLILMKILLKINDFIDIKSSTFIILLLTFLTGQFKPILIFLTLSGIHEIGHFLACLCFKVEVKKMTILPFGFNLQLKDYVELKPLQEFIIYISGPAMYFVNALLLSFLYQKNIISEITYEFAKNGNLAINLFNLLPIYPLDGFRIFNSTLQMMTPYKKSLKFSCIFSLFIFFLLCIYNFYQPQIVITIFLFFMQWQYIKELPYLYRRFLYIKTSNKKYKRFKVLKNYDMYKEKNNYKIEQEKILDDRMIALKLLKENNQDF